MPRIEGVRIMELMSPPKKRRSARELAEAKAWAGKVLRARKSSGLTQSQTADALGVPLGTLRNWEQERVVPPTYLHSLIIRAILEAKV
jgi:DNA-binding transcriptional regulator YiaG